jgi:hypothetical protein
MQVGSNPVGVKNKSAMPKSKGKPEIKSLLSDDEKIETIIHSFKNYNLGDILDIRKTGKPIACFILASCLIGQLGRHRYFNIHRGDGECFKNFVFDYFPDEYKSVTKKLYASLRSTLVHNYSTEAEFSLGYEPSSEIQHLAFMTTGSRYLHIDCFIRDLIFAFERYTEDLKTDPKIRAIAITHFKSYPVLSLLQREFEPQTES